MKQIRISRLFSIFLVFVLIFQSFGMQFLSTVSAEENEGSDLRKFNATYGATVRGGEHAEKTAASGTSDIPREYIEAKWAGDMSYSRRSHLEFDLENDIDWESIKEAKLVLYLDSHTGNGKQDTIQVFKTPKSDISEENWTWKTTENLMEDPILIGEQKIVENDAGSWVELDITDLAEEMTTGEKNLSLALYPKVRDDQGGVKFFSHHAENGKYAPYVVIYEDEYQDIIPPTIHVEGLEDGQTYFEEELIFSIQAIDNYDEDPKITLTLNGEEQTAMNGDNTVTLVSGSNTIIIYAEDESGNKSDEKAFNIKFEKSSMYPVIHDTYTDIRYKDTNFNNSTEKGGLQLKEPASASSTRKVYLSFDVSNNDSSYVKEATIKLFAHELMGTDRTSEIINIYEIEDFDETTLTWNNAPENGEKVADASYERVGHQRYFSLDVTEYINKKLSEDGNLERVNFVLQINNGHDQKGAFIGSKEQYPENPPQLLFIEGLPAPNLTVEGIEDHAVITESSIKDVSIKASSVSDQITVNLDIKVNGESVSAKENGLYDLPLILGKNDIQVTATDSEGNKTEENYSVIRLESSGSNTFYVDSQSGNDENDGLSEATAWKSLDKLNTLQFEPGARILFKRGGTWNGQFRPKGSGTVNKPIIIDAYGDEDAGMPIINGQGISNLDTGNAIAEGAVHLYNVSFWEIKNIEVTNQGPENNQASRAGIMVFAGGHGFMEHIHIDNVYVHDVNSGLDTPKFSGGIIFRSDTMDEKGNITNVDSGFTDILVENSHVKRVTFEGLRTKTHKNGGDTGSVQNHDVVFRNNLIEDTFGDGIVMSEVYSGGLIEKNIVRKHSNNETSRNYAGLWLWYTEDVIIQHNEVYDGVNGYNDGEAFDFDLGTKRNIYQYNYSHNNRGGLLLTMSGAGEGNVFRYNISKNDGHSNQETFFVMNDRTHIYNNTIFIDEGIRVKYFVNDNNITNMHFNNNILYVKGDLERYSAQSNEPNTFEAKNMANNLIYPAKIMDLPGSPKPYPGLIMEDPLLADPTAEDIVMDTWDQEIWDKNIAKFKLQEDSPAIDGGIVIEGAGETDIYGNPLYEGMPDIGAHEYIEEPEVPSIDTSLLAELIEEAQNISNEDGTYTESSFEALQLAITEALSVLDTVESEDDVAKAIDALETAISGLEEVEEPEVPSIDTSSLEELIDKAQDISNEDGKYTASSFEALQQAITEALSALDTVESEDDVAKAIDALETAIAGLEEVEEPEVPSIDTSSLEKLIEKAQNISNEDGTYTASSFEELQLAVIKAKADLETIESEEDLVSAVDALEAAISGLEKVEEPEVPSIDTSSLEGLIEEAQNISNEDGMYTEESFEALQLALAKAEAALVTIESEDDLAAAIEALEAAIIGLEEVEKPVNPEKPEEDEDRDKDKDKDESVTVNPEKDQTDDKKDGEKLPKTASNIFNYIIIGLFLIFASALLLLFHIKRKKEVN